MDKSDSHKQETKQNRLSENGSQAPLSDQMREEPSSNVVPEVNDADAAKTFKPDDKQQAICSQTSETGNPVELSAGKFAQVSTGLELKENKIEDGTSTIIYNTNKCLGKRVYAGKIVRQVVVQDKLAVKLRTIDRSLSQEDIDKQYLDEIKIAIKLLAHDNVARYVKHLTCYLSNELTVVIVTELCNHEKLESHLPGFSIEEKKILLVQLCHGLKHIHAKQITHRDLKPSNVLLSIDGKHIKIIDFGISKEFALDENKTITRSSGFSGTLGWVASEMCPDDRSKEFEAWVKADLYSLGLVIYFIFTDGEHPYQGDRFDKHQSIKMKKKPNFSVIEDAKQFHERYLLIDLLKIMLSHEPDARPGIEKILQHCFTWKEKKKMNFIHVCHRYFEQPCDEDKEMPKRKAKRKLESNGSVEQRMAYVVKESIDTYSSDDSQDSVQFDPPNEEVPQDNNELVRTKKEDEALKRIYEIVSENWVELILKKLEDPNDGNCNPYKNSFTDLVRCIRNTHEYYDKKSKIVKSKLGSKDRGMWNFFALNFPELFIYLFHLMKNGLEGDDEKNYLQKEAKNCALP
uniref:sensor for unfolded proteins in the ER ire1-like isoform X1 n=1 Tax=Styela clava TaxID=7725 RepID=UPI001939373B|nr:sensor for unfolded proteins in the ER ire1-like isoform X1 [Styela clava]